MASALPATFVAGFHSLEAIKRMPYRTLGQAGRLVSALSFGASSLGGSFSSMPDEVVKPMVVNALKAGINVIDTAPWYGNGLSESRLGMALEGVPRQAYYIHTKVGRYAPEPLRMFDFTYERTMRSVDESLARMRVEYIDTIQVHDPEFAPSLDVIIKETLPALRACQAAGKVKHIGITGYPLEALRYLADNCPPDIKLETALSYCRYNLHDQGLVSTGLLSHLKSKGLGIICASPMSMGLLTHAGPPVWHPATPELKAACVRAAAHCAAAGVDISRLALAFTLQNPDIATILVSAVSLDILNENIAIVTGAKGLSEDEKRVMGEVQQLFADSGAPRSWEGVEPGRYWQEVGKQLMTSWYASVGAARSSGGTAAASTPEAAAAAAVSAANGRK